MSRRLPSYVHLYRLAAVVMLLVGCSSSPPPKPAATYTVKAGDTLYSIAWRNGLDHRDLARANGIGRDFAIRPGQVLKLRVDAPAASTVVATKPNAATAAKRVAWVWPLKGQKVTQTHRPNGGRGMTITANLGQDIHSAAAGRVVYTGSGMLGYGQLVIIKHNDSYLSAYGHTQAIKVRENEAVKAGQTIATLGAGPTGEPLLYFEIRLNGRPVDPVSLLPQLLPKQLPKQ